MEKLEVQYVGYEDKDGYRNGFQVLENGKSTFSIFEGEPEDMTLGRDLSDCCGIINDFERFYKLGMDGVEVVFLPSIEKDWSEIE